jgi:hypothetical protein
MAADFHDPKYRSLMGTAESASLRVRVAVARPVAPVKVPILPYQLIGLPGDGPPLGADRW